MTGTGTTGTGTTGAAGTTDAVGGAGTGRRRGGVRLRGVGKSYGQGEAEVRALHDVDLDIDPGQLVVVLGPSGSGKTTLLNLVGGIEEATTGTLEVAGVDIGGRDVSSLADFRREHVGFVFQFFNLIPTLTAAENVEVMVELTGRGDRDGVAALLDAVDLGDRGDHFPAQLSGGQQQRVAVARALATDPDLLLCDEPTGALDLDTGRRVLELLAASGRAGRTVVMVTHNAALAAMADAVVHVSNGRIESVEPNAAPVEPSSLTW